MGEGAVGAAWLHRFVLEHQPVRGFLVRLDGAWDELRAVHPYPPPIERLLGETVGATVLLAATLKFHGKLTVQLGGGGLVPLLVAQCTQDFAIRGVAQHADPLPERARFAELIGDGRLVVTVEADRQGSRYQGIVPLQGGSVGECLETYFATSEQLPTRLKLVCADGRLAGLLLQQLPGGLRGEHGADSIRAAWDELQPAFQSLASEELLDLEVDQLLVRVAGRYDCRRFGPTGVRFECRCSPQRVGELLRSIGEAEARSVLAEQGAVTVTCEFCRRAYRFEAADVERLFAAWATPGTPPLLN